MKEAIGWSSSIILLITLIMQIRKQIDAGSNKGVSKWLFLGQLAASIGFLTYSVLTGDTVFIFTNSALTLTAVIGIYLYFHNRNRKEEAR